MTEIYLSECNDGGFFTFSVDSIGSNLPRSACRSGWTLRNHLKLGDLIEEEYAAAVGATTVVRAAGSLPRRYS